MRLKHIIVVGSVLLASAAMTLQAQSQEWIPGAGFKEFKLMGLDLDWYSAPLQGRVTKGAPYSAEVTTENTQTLGDGNRIVHRSSEKVYRDAEGRVRREQTTGSKVTVTITDPVAGRSFTLDPTTRTARQTAMLPLFFFDNLWTTKPGEFTKSYRQPLTGTFARVGRGSMTGTMSADARESESDWTIGFGGGRRSKPRAAGEQYVEEQLPNRTIEGVVASGIRRTTTIPQGAIGNEQPIKIVSEEWTSADLKLLVLTDTNDPRTGRSTYKLTNINRADPDPSLFKVPADYTMGGRGRDK